MGIILPHLGHNISTKPPLFALGKPQNRSKGNPEETLGNNRDFRVVLVCWLPRFFHPLLLYFYYGVSLRISTRNHHHV